MHLFRLSNYRNNKVCLLLHPYFYMYQNIPVRYFYPEGNYRNPHSSGISLHTWIQDDKLKNPWKIISRFYKSDVHKR